VVLHMVVSMVVVVMVVMTARPCCLTIRCSP
jgi:hypothetical protein